MKISSPIKKFYLRIISFIQFLEFSLVSFVKNLYNNANLYLALHPLVYIFTTYFVLFLISRTFGLYITVYAEGFSFISAHSESPWPDQGPTKNATPTEILTPATKALDDYPIPYQFIPACPSSVCRREDILPALTPAVRAVNDFPQDPYKICTIPSSICRREQSSSEIAAVLELLKQAESHDVEPYIQKLLKFKADQRNAKILSEAAANYSPNPNNFSRALVQKINKVLPLFDNPLYKNDAAFYKLVDHLKTFHDEAKSNKERNFWLQCMSYLLTNHDCVRLMEKNGLTKQQILSEYATYYFNTYTFVSNMYVEK